MRTIFREFERALKKKYAIGAFNFYNLETLQSILDAGEQAKATVICAVSESALAYMGLDNAVMMFEILNQDKKYPAFLHLDHGKSFKICKQAIDAGFDSVMIDASSLSFEENVKLTKKVVDYAKKYGVFVESELGTLSGIEDDVNVNDAKFTDPDQAKYFIELTKTDCLAVAIGTSHGAYKFKGNPRLRMDILQEIENKIGKFPLVLHGASTVEKSRIQKINKFGGNIKEAAGIPDSMINEICKNHNICKVNFDTDLRLAFISVLREELTNNPAETNPRNLLTKAKKEMTEVVKNKILNLSGNFRKNI